MVHHIKHYIPHILFLVVGILLIEYLGKSFLVISIYSASIIIGALILAWAAESAEILISEGLALAIVAWVQVLPEFLIEASIALTGNIAHLLANFTGANRILTGVGWPLVFFTTVFFYWKRHKKFYRELKIGRERSVEVIFLFMATLYFFVVYFKKTITLIDSIVLGGIYVLYLFVISRLPHASRKKVKSLYKGIPKKIIMLKKNKAKIVVSLMFFLGGILIFIAVKPFYSGMLALATTLGISQFMLIQWVAPFLSEFPEKTSAFYWASKIKTAPLAMMNLISSKITQWTALLSLIPIVLTISTKQFSFVPVTGFLSVELLLTIFTSLYASVFLMKLRINYIEAASLFIFWILQFIFVGLRPYMVLVYALLIILEIIIYKKEMLNAFKGFKHIWKYYIFPKDI